MKVKKLTSREVTILLASLRIAQKNIPILAMMEHFTIRMKMPTSEEIDRLCEKLNCSNKIGVEP